MDSGEAFNSPRLVEVSEALDVILTELTKRGVVAGQPVSGRKLSIG